MMILIKICLRFYYWDSWFNVWWYNMWRSTSCEHGWYGWYNMWLSSIGWSKSRCVWEWGNWPDDIMCDDIKCEDQHLASILGMDDIIYDDLTCNALNQSVCELVLLGLMI